jgi:hypothetical protein
MFEKLWEWIMGIIAWIVSKFTRVSVGGAKDTKEESPAPQEKESDSESEDQPPAPSE